MSSLHLSSDDRSSFQSHLNELSQRLTSVIILAIILTGFWSLSIDEILNNILLRLDPCQEICVTIFSPDEWAATRWLAAGILGILSTGPYAMMQAHSFAKPGLLPTERRGFAIWMVSVWIIAIASLWITVSIIIPWFFEWGHSFTEGTGLQGRYDAAEMLNICISVAWAMILVLASMTVVAIAGKSRLLWSGNAGWWRLRIHGMMVMLLWLVIPSSLPGIMIMLTIAAISIVEFVGFPYFHATIPNGHGIKDIFDGDGGIHRVIYADCACCGTTPSIAPLSGMGIVNFDAVCRYHDEQDVLLDLLKRFRITDLVFSGCVIESLAPELIASIRQFGISIRSLDLAHLATIRADDVSVDYQLAMAGLNDPWSISSSNEKILKILHDGQISALHYGNNIPFGLQLSMAEAWISSPTDSLIEFLSNNDFLLIPHSN